MKNNAAKNECKLLKDHLTMHSHVKLCLGSLAGTGAHLVT